MVYTKKRYKISIIDHVGNKAGMDYYSTSLALGLKNNNVDCTIFSNFKKNEYFLDFRPVFKRNKNKIQKLLNFITGIFKASFYSKRKNVDLVIVHFFSSNLITLPLVLIPKLFKLKVALIIHDVSSFANNDNKLLQKFIYNNLSDFLIVHNKFSYEELIKNVTIHNLEKIRIIKHGGYFDHIKLNFTKKFARKELKLDEHGKYILFFGQIKKVKGLDILLEALRLLPSDIKLIIAGQPWKDDFSKYQEIIDKYNLENRVVKILRFIEDEEREKLFYASDLNVIPYKIIYQSGVLLMSMSYGVPVIASDLPPNKEIIIDKKNGLLFKSNSYISLAKKIKYFFENFENIKNIGENAKNTIRLNYDWNKIAQDYISLLK